MKRKSWVVLGIACSVVFIGAALVFGAEARKKMTILYSDGKKQEVLLNAPSGEIVAIDFSADGAALRDAGRTSKEYKDTKGAKIVIPCGKLAFADRVVSFRMGIPSPKDARAMNPGSALGEPDYVSDEIDLKLPVFTALTLGCGGTVTLEFTKVRLIDVEGPDLHIFEVGPAMEPTHLEISKDGVAWITIGRVSGGKASVDIHNFVAPGDQFRFVRLTDLKEGCGGDWPGADIDAVAAIGCVLVP
jgi:OOP family OmpA-OmpF porin